MVGRCIRWMVHVVWRGMVWHGVRRWQACQCTGRRAPVDRMLRSELLRHHWPCWCQQLGPSKHRCTNTTTALQPPCARARTHIARKSAHTCMHACAHQRERTKEGLYTRRMGGTACCRKPTALLLHRREAASFGHLLYSVLAVRSVIRRGDKDMPNRADLSAHSQHVQPGVAICKSPTTPCLP